MKQNEYYDVCLDFIANLNERDALKLWNAYCLDSDKSHLYIYPNEAEIYRTEYTNVDPYEIVREVSSNQVSIGDNYVVFASNGPKTFNFIDDYDSPFDKYEIIELGLNGIYELLNKCKINTDKLDAMAEEYMDDAPEI